MIDKSKQTLYSRGGPRIDRGGKIFMEESGKVDMIQPGNPGSQNSKRIEDFRLSPDMQNVVTQEQDSKIPVSQENTESSIFSSSPIKTHVVAEADNAQVEMPKITVDTPNELNESQESEKAPREFLFSGSTAMVRDENGTVKSGIVAGYDGMTGEATVTVVGENGMLEILHMPRSEFFNLNKDTPNRDFRSEEMTDLKDKGFLVSGSFVEILGTEGSETSEKWMIAGYNDDTGEVILVKRRKNEQGYFNGNLETKIIDRSDEASLKTVDPYPNMPLAENPKANTAASNEQAASQAQAEELVEEPVVKTTANKV